jgi:hypothetical protein
VNKDESRTQTSGSFLCPGLVPKSRQAR